MSEGMDFAQRIAEDKAIRSHMDKIGRKIPIMSGKGGGQDHDDGQPCQRPGRHGPEGGHPRSTSPRPQRG